MRHVAAAAIPCECEGGRARWRNIGGLNAAHASAVEASMADSTHWSFPTPLQPVAAEVGFDLPRALDAVVRLSSRVPEDGFTASSLGTEREGNGVIIRDDGLIVTIGYLITEAEGIWITANDGRVVPGHPLAYDFTTGMGLVLPLGRLGIALLDLAAQPALGVRRGETDERLERTRGERRRGADLGALPRADQGLLVRRRPDRGRSPRGV